MKYSLIIFFIIISHEIRSQGLICREDTVIRIDFGTKNSPADINAKELRYYGKVNSTCPDDGYYSFATHTEDCFGGHWITVPQDHTRSDKDGRMMIVNASETPSEFFITTINHLSPNTSYELSAWMVNVCKTTVGCTEVSPNISFFVRTTTGSPIAKYNIGILSPDRFAFWRKYSFIFKTPANTTSAIIIFRDNTTGGCGNDFAMDDITVVKCDSVNAVIEEKPEPKPTPKTEVPKPVVPKPVKKDTVAVVNTAPKEIPVVIKPAVKDTPAMIRPEIIKPIPKVLETRANPLIKHIFTDSAELTIELYDNGIIDGDTVSIYHNNELVVANKGLSDKPITLKIKVDASHPHHEIVMVANNLGSIPPNTSLMIVTAKGKRYEVFISSDDKMNAKVEIDWKK